MDIKQVVREVLARGEFSPPDRKGRRPGFIRNRDLAKLTQTSGEVIRDWRRRGFLPTDQYIPKAWIGIVKEVREAQAMQLGLRELFAAARGRLVASNGWAPR